MAGNLSGQAMQLVNDQRWVFTVYFHKDNPPLDDDEHPELLQQLSIWPVTAPTDTSQNLRRRQQHLLCTPRRYFSIAGLAL
jgi:hypothetical protein